MGLVEWKSYADACLDCAAVCKHCANWCMKEGDSDVMAECIQLNMECAAVCVVTAQLLTLKSDSVKEIGVICAEVCVVCGEACSRYENQHCRECARVCLACAQQGREMAA